MGEDENNPDFLLCECCEGSFYKGDLENGLCFDCANELFGDGND